MVPQREPPTTPNQAGELAGILRQLGITDFDVCLIGDGSGTGWNDACGWACVLVDRLTHARQLFHGGMSTTSINVAEFMPYLQALCWYHSQHGSERMQRSGMIKVHVITDSQVTAVSGNRAADLTLTLPRANQALWASIRQFTTMGYRLQYHWLNRETTLYNQCADLVASLCRRAVLNVARVPEGDPVRRQALARTIQQALAQVRLADPASGANIDLTELDPSVLPEPPHE